MKKILIFICLFGGIALQFSVSFGAQPQESKSFWEIVNDFKNWASGKASKAYESAPSAERATIATAGAAAVFGGIRPTVALSHGVGGIMAIQGVRQAWNAILTGKISS